MKTRTLLAALVALALATLASATIGLGDSRDDVLRQLGKPTSVARRGNHEILLYPKGVRIELEDGKVVDVKGAVPTSATPPASAPAADTTKASVATNTPPATTRTAPPPAATNATTKAPPAAKKTKPPTAVHSPDDDYNPAVAANELAKHVEKMDTAWGEAPKKPEVHSPLESIPSFLTGLVLRFGITLLALKLAFKVWEMDTLWKGLFAITGIDLALHALFELLGPVTGGFTTIRAVENGIPGLVLIYTINRFCFNKRIQDAVLTAALVKVVVALCYVFVGVAALEAIYG